MSDHYLETEKIGKLMMKFSVPCVLSLLVSSLYNIVDQIFIGQGIGYIANGATNVVFPVTIIALALALFIGDGCAAFLSLCQGKKDGDSAHRSVGQAIILVVCCSMVLVLIGVTLSEQLLWGFGATENNIGYARDYFSIIVVGLPFFMFANCMNSIIRADGSPQFAMLSMIAGAVINVILDPLAIFVFGWGIKGAAVATIAGQIVSAVLAVCYLFHTKSFKLTAPSFAVRAGLIKQFLSLGISSFLTQISIVIIMAVMNNALVSYGAQSKYGSDIPLTVVGIVMKVFQVVIAFVVGIAAGAQPVTGYNYGAGNYGRVREIYRKMMAAEVVIGVIAVILFECFPMQIIRLFGSESDLYNEFGVLAFRIYLSMILLCCIQKSTSIFLQSLGKPVLSMSLSLLRDFVFIIPAIFILARMYGVTGILYSAPIADVLAFIVVIVFMRRVFAEMPKEEAIEAQVSAAV